MVNHIQNNSGNQEWYTPAQYIESVRSVMGGIDLDPASNDLAQKVVKAREYYTLEKSGLNHEWHGRIFLNPPYGRKIVDEFVDKLSLEVEKGNVQEFVVLVNNATETKWAQKLLRVSNLVCFPSGRIKFLSPTGVKNSPLQGQMFLYKGYKINRFCHQFSKYGTVISRIN